MTCMVFCTDDLYFTNLMPYLFQQHRLQVIPTNQLMAALNSKSMISHYILGFPRLNASDWELIDLVVNSTSVPVFIMVQREITAAEAERSRSLGVQGVLLDPLLKLRSEGAAVHHILDALLYRIEEDESIDDEAVFLGQDTYFNPNQNWIVRSGVKTQLSDREAELMKLLLRYEGKILTKETIANQLWQGRVVSGGIPKLVARLRRKLGVAGELIRGRKQGGYIYEK